MINKFDWSSSQVGLTFSSFGIAGVLILLSFPILTLHASDMELILFGMCIMVASCIVVALQYQNSSEGRFMLALAMMYSVGYPIGHTALIGKFSKLLKSGQQGTYLGWFGSAGSLARILFPLIAGVLADNMTDECLVFGFMGLLLIIPIVIVAYYRNSV